MAKFQLLKVRPEPKANSFAIKLIISKREKEAVALSCMIIF